MKNALKIVFYAIVVYALIVGLIHVYFDRADYNKGLNIDAEPYKPYSRRG